MAKQELHPSLEKGVDHWNNWRKENPSILPSLSVFTLLKATLAGVDLSGINLSGVDTSLVITLRAKLSGADLSGNKLTRANLSMADLSEANFSGADLTGADLLMANLTGADLSGTKLTGANLLMANLSGADLSGADISEAKLSGTDLSGANLSGANLSGVDLFKANFSGTDLTGANLLMANLTGADLSGTKLTGANLSKSNLSKANFSGADLSKANLQSVDLSGANLTGANLTEANLTEANLMGTILEKSIMNNCKIYGINVWNCKGEIAEQKDLIITPHNEPEVTVDNIKIAQFIYLLLENKEIRNVIDTLTSKAVLILGRFTAERKDVLDAIKDELRKRNYLPILFDFDKPASKDLTETIMTLANISRFIIADITDAKSIPQELSHIVPHLPSLAVVPIILDSQREYGMFEHFGRYPWVLPLYAYPSKEGLLSLLNEKVIDPAERKVEELRPRK